MNPHQLKQERKKETVNEINLSISDQETRSSTEQGVFIMDEKMGNESQDLNELRFDGDSEMTELGEQELEAVVGGFHLENPNDTLTVPDYGENSAMGVVYGGRGMKKLPSC